MFGLEAISALPGTVIDDFLAMNGVDSVAMALMRRIASELQTQQIHALSTEACRAAQDWQ